MDKVWLRFPLTGSQMAVMLQQAFGIAVEIEERKNIVAWEIRGGTLILSTVEESEQGNAR